MEDDLMSKEERLAECLRRLGESPPARSFTEAYTQLCNILNEVEDAMTDVPYNPENWQTDGRLYPPLMDNVRIVPNHPSVKRFRSFRHNTFIGENGSIEVQELTLKETIFSKPGEDGKGVWDI